MKFPAGTESDPLTQGFHGERGWKWCRCVNCKTVARCTPDNDFFYFRGRDGLYCFKCMGPILAETYQEAVREMN